jgi:hypothetical protein
MLLMLLQELQYLRPAIPFPRSCIDDEGGAASTRGNNAALRGALEPLPSPSEVAKYPCQQQATQEDGEEE